MIPENRLITMRMFGKHGRWANQLFQYSFLQVYAKTHNLQVQIPPWVGQEVFSLDDPPVDVNLPVAFERYENGGSCICETILPRGDEFVNRDWRGYGQFHTSWYRPHAEMIRQMFTPIESIQQRMAPAVEKLYSMGKTIIGAHLRVGDYGRMIFYVTPVQWYLDWLKKHWAEYDNPVLFIAAEDRKLVDQFAEYNPVTAESLGTELSTSPHANYGYLGPDRRLRDPWQMDFYPDFYLLSKCNVLLTPNSTFSFVAAMLADRLQHFYRSDLPTQNFVEVDPWNTQPLTHDLAEDWRHVPGVCLDETAYWRRNGSGYVEIME